MCVIITIHCAESRVTVMHNTCSGRRVKHINTFTQEERERQSETEKTDEKAEEQKITSKLYEKNEIL